MTAATPDSMTPCRHSLNQPARRAFTLVELLVVIAIIGLLIGILLPVLGRARQCAVLTGELSSARQLLIAHRTYSHENNDQFMPGFPSAQMIQRGDVVVRDQKGERLPSAGMPAVVAQRYPWRILPYLDYVVADWYRDKRAIESLTGTDNFAYAVSVAPRFGLNQTFVGGSADGDTGYAFNSAYETLARRAWGANWYARRTSDVRSPTQMIVFASASDVDPSRTVTIDGFYRVSAPAFIERQWRTEAPTATTPPGETGSVSFRFAGRTVAAMVDGHAETLNFEQAQDMRRWSPQATGPDWTLKQP